MIVDLPGLRALPESLFEEGTVLNFYLRNKSDKPNTFVISDFVQPYGGIQFVCRPDGAIPESQTPEDIEGLWRHGGDGFYEVGRYPVEEGDYLIQVRTPDGFDAVLGQDDYPYDPVIIISEVIALEDLEVFSSMAIRIRVLKKFKVSEKPLLGVLRDPIQYALQRVS